MARFCANCGTQVEEDARFCPACGEPIEPDAANALPPAPAWPAPEPEPGAEQAAHADGSPAVTEQSTLGPPPEPGHPSAGHEMPEASSPPVAASPRARPTPQGVTLPATLSGWLVGAGAAVAALSIFLPWVPFAERYTAGWGLASGLNVLLLLLLLAVAATIFFAEAVPRPAHLELAILAVALIGLGVGLDRLAIGGAAAGAILFTLGVLAASLGAILPLIGRDVQVGGPRA